MLKSVEGVYSNGKIELLEAAPDTATGRVIVTFLDAKTISLSDRGIDEHHAADLRHRFRCFAEDWNRPEMDVYDAP